MSCIKIQFQKAIVNFEWTSYFCRGFLFLLIPCLFDLVVNLGYRFEVVNSALLRSGTICLEGEEQNLVMCLWVGCFNCPAFESSMYDIRKCE